MTAWRLLLIPAAALVGSTPADPGSAPQLQLPLACEIGRTCEIQNYVDRDAGPAVIDYACSSRTYGDHNGIDFRIPDMASQRAGVAVLVAAAGTVAGIRDGVEDVSVKAIGLDTVKGRECGNGVLINHGGGWQSQYCHMARGSIAVKTGDVVRVGQPIGRVGLSGFTEYPHLHMTVRQNGQVVDPFDPDPADHGCRARGDLWTPAARAALVYKRGAVLNIGLTDRALTGAEIEEGRLSAPSIASSALVGYVRAIGLERGDTQLLELAAPDGSILAASAIPALDRAKAQWFAFAGKKKSAATWPSGSYVVSYRLMRDGAAVVTRRFAVKL